MRLIDADALKADMRNVILEDGDDRRTFYEVIERQPTIDAVEVVRRKDCRYYNTTNCCDGCGWCERSGMDRGSWDNWFCADGVRKESE